MDEGVVEANPASQSLPTPATLTVEGEHVGSSSTDDAENNVPTTTDPTTTTTTTTTSSAPLPSLSNNHGVTSISSLASMTSTGYTDHHHRHDGPVMLAWKGLSVYANHGLKQVLFSLDGNVTGGFYAILGPSGSGKTSLLNTLACRLDGNMKVCCMMRMFGE